MEEWKEYKLGDVCTMIPGFAFKSKDFGIGKDIAIKIKDIRPPFVETKEADNVDTSNYNQKKLSKFVVHKGEFLLAMTGATIGKIGKYICEEPAYVNQRVLKFEDAGFILYDYLYYYLSTDVFQSFITNHIDSQSAQPNISSTTIGKYPIKVPSIKVQKQIVSILKSLDDKIEVNRKINENLEQQAQALFKSWFVDFEPFKNGEFVESELGMIPKGWRVEKIGNLPINVTDYVANGSFASLKENVKLYQTPEYAYFIRNTDLKSGNYEVYVDKHSYEFLSKSTLYGGEVIISNVGDVGSVHLCPYLDKPMTLGNNIIMLKPDKQYYSFFLYILFKWAYGNDLIMSIKGGSAQPKFNKTDFKSLKIIVPNDVVLEKYHSIISSLFNKIRVLEDESRRLASLRDTLLPKLMSGELKVNEIEDVL